MNIFTYGTLMYPEVLDPLVSEKYMPQKSILNGYCRKAIIGEHYPGIVKKDASRVEGVLYTNVSPKDLNKLDEYEGDQYIRTSVKVILDGNSIRADTYVFQDRYLHLLSKKDWNPDDFEERYLHVYTNLYKDS